MSSCRMGSRALEAQVSTTATRVVDTRGCGCEWRCGGDEAHVAALAGFECGGAAAKCSTAAARLHDSLGSIMQKTGVSLTARLRAQGQEQPC